MLDWRAYALLAPLLFFAGFVDAIGGGGGLISLPAYLLAGLPAHTALGCNKFSSTCGTTASVFRFVQRGFIRREFLLLIPFALIGSAIGTRLTLLLDEYVFRLVLLAVLPFTALFLLRTKTLERAENRKETELSTRSCLLAAGIAFVIGGYDGFYGPGTGTFLLVLLCALARFPLKSALGAGKLINYSSNIASLILWLFHGKVVFPLVLITASSNILGQYIGARLVTTKGARLVRPIVLFVLSLMAVKILYDLFG